MAEVKWIKIVTDIFDDEKILLIDSLPERDNIIVIWFKLLCMAGKQNNGGIFMMNDKIAYTDEMLATIFRRPLSTVKLALKIFEQYEMIEIVNDAITIPKWEYHQNIDELRRIKEQNNERVRRYRERQKEIANKCNVTETLCNGADKNRLDKSRLDKERENITKTSSRFHPPTLEEITKYAEERKSSVNPERFYDYYKARGWKTNKGLYLKDWKAAYRSWEKNGYNDKAPSNQANDNSSFSVETAEQIACERYRKSS